jgi:hypothetical protein
VVSGLRQRLDASDEYRRCGARTVKPSIRSRRRRAEQILAKSVGDGNGDFGANGPKADSPLNVVLAEAQAIFTACAWSLSGRTRHLAYLSAMIDGGRRGGPPIGNGWRKIVRRICGRVSWPVFDRGSCRLSIGAFATSPIKEIIHLREGLIARCTKSGVFAAYANHERQQQD